MGVGVFSLRFSTEPPVNPPRQSVAERIGPLVRSQSAQIAPNPIWVPRTGRRPSAFSPSHNGVSLMSTHVRHPRHHETRPSIACREAALKLRSFADLSQADAQDRILGAKPSQKFLGPLGELPPIDRKA